ncbi:hypothetical protein BD410DRAFT_789240, partial [Rickenella mellea]
MYGMRLRRHRTRADRFLTSGLRVVYRHVEADLPIPSTLGGIQSGICFIAVRGWAAPVVRLPEYARYDWEPV